MVHNNLETKLKIKNITLTLPKHVLLY